MMRNNITSFILIILMVACSRDESIIPKQRGYMRIQLPRREYKFYKNKYSFEIPSTSIVNRDSSFNKKEWFNLYYPYFNATIYFSYINGNEINKYEEDSRKFVNKHIEKSTGIEETEIIISKKDIYAMIFDINGSKTASPIQFYLTDRKNNFIRGSLYFDISPNNDSLEPVIKYIREDILHMIKTFNWK